MKGNWVDVTVNVTFIILLVGMAVLLGPPIVGVLTHLR